MRTTLPTLQQLPFKEIKFINRKENMPTACPNHSPINYRARLLTASLIAGAVVFASAASFGLPSFAQTLQNQDAQNGQETTSQVTLTAIPPRLGDDGSLLLQPGEKKQVQLRVKNTSNQPIEIVSRALDFIIDQDGETPMPIDDITGTSNRWSLASWLAVVPNQQTLKPGETAAVSVLIEVPEDALPGGHYAMIIHQPNPERGDRDGEQADPLSVSGVSQQVGSLLYVVVDGPINEAAYINNFQFADFSEYGPVPYTFTIDNQSDIHIQPKIGIDIYNMLGRKTDTIVVESKNVFPLASRDFDGKWDRIWGFGRYTAKMTVSFGDQGQIIMDKTSFWLLPIKLILTALILILVFLASLISIRRHLLHRNNDEQKRIELLEKRLREMEDEKLKKYED
jgi:hypothetical protein